MSKKSNTYKAITFGSTLDSLQGIWYPTGDRNSGHINIVDRVFEVYTGVTPNDYYRIYFSDTKITEDDWANVTTVDTTVSTGRYLLLVSRDGIQSVECFKFGTVYDDGISQSFGMIATQSPFQKISYER